MSIRSRLSGGESTPARTNPAARRATAALAPGPAGRILEQPRRRRDLASDEPVAEDHQLHQVERLRQVDERRLRAGQRQPSPPPHLGRGGTVVRAHPLGPERLTGRYAYVHRRARRDRAAPEQRRGLVRDDRSGRCQPERRVGPQGQCPWCLTRHVHVPVEAGELPATQLPGRQAGRQPLGPRERLQRVEATLRHVTRCCRVRGARRPAHPQDRPGWATARPPVDDPEGPSWRDRDFSAFAALCYRFGADLFRRLSASRTTCGPTGLAQRDACGADLEPPDDIEYEGRQHRDDDEIWAADIERREELDREPGAVFRSINKGLFETPLPHSAADRSQTRVRPRGSPDRSPSVTSGSATSRGR